MKKWLLGIILAIGIISVGMVASTYAAEANPFNGTFSGTAYGDYDSTAPLTLNLTQEGDIVTAHIDIENGLQVNAGGFCGVIAIPAGSVSASASDTADSADVVSARVPIDLGSGVSITAYIDGEIDDDNLDFSVKVKTPFICSNDPVVTGSLVAQ
jgi:hypothetical protein